ncbi:MAG: glucoamylase family protein [Bacteroidales bacterium]|jgi:hypothetical protein|nr:glucoamylase family protein [Bacteroidales bacterium]
MKQTTIHEFIVMLLIMTIAINLQSCNKEPAPVGKLEILSCFAGETQLQLAAEVPNIALNTEIILNFSVPLDTNLSKQGISIKDLNNATFGVQYKFSGDMKTLRLTHQQDFGKLKSYTVFIAGTVKGTEGESFTGAEYRFKTSDGKFNLIAATIDGQDFTTNTKFYNIKRKDLRFSLEFSEPVDTAGIAEKFSLSNDLGENFEYADNYRKVDLTLQGDLEGYRKYTLVVSSGLESVYGNQFEGFSNSFFTEADSTFKFPVVTDEELLTIVQQQTFRFFYDYAHPVSGMTRERLGSGDVITSGGSGFGVMALIVGMERGFITRAEGMARLEKIIGFLETCDRFHGAWSHWINGSNGYAIPFSTKDNGGDLVETAYMAQGLITMRQYLNPLDPAESDLASRITELFNTIEWSWYTRGGQSTLYWHWSPTYNWDMNMKIQGYNETLITYILAASSPTYTIPAMAYKSGYARNGGIINGKTFYGYTLPVGYDYGGPLFFAHYSFLGLDPRNLSDNYANYWTQNVNHSLINWAYCADNPKSFPNYSAHCWGLTAGDIPSGYGVSEPTNDRGVITPTAAVSSLPFTPEQSMDAIRFFYYILGDKLWGDYGFYDAFDVHVGWWAGSYIAIDQGPQVVMIENYRTGLLWDLFMSAPEVQAGLEKLGFSY